MLLGQLKKLPQLKLNLNQLLRKQNLSRLQLVNTENNLSVKKVMVLTTPTANESGLGILMLTTTGCQQKPKLKPQLMKKSKTSTSFTLMQKAKSTLINMSIMNTSADATKTVTGNGTKANLTMLATGTLNKKYKPPKSTLLMKFPSLKTLISKALMRMNGCPNSIQATLKKSLVTRSSLLPQASH